MTERTFKTEAELCETFLLWVARHAGVKHPTAYAAALAKARESAA